MDRLPCEECRAAFASSRWDTAEDRARKAPGPPCATCRPTLLPGNMEAFEVFNQCDGQWIMGLDGAVALSIPAVATVMELEGVRDRRGCLAKVLFLASVMLSEVRRKQSKQKGLEDQQDQ